MTEALIVIPTLCYGAAAASYAMKGNPALGVVYFGYAVANLGLLWLDRLQAK